jgi:hypothetical protein
MIAFLLLLFVLMVIYLCTSTTATAEGFNPMNTSPSHKINLPLDAIPRSIPSTTPAACSNQLPVKPYSLPGEIPIAPYEQIASMSPLPYQDTTLIKANRQQLISLLEMLKGFLAFEAQEISELSDPTIQLPLSTARSDFHMLQSQVEVLNRNPGIQPTVTLSHLNEIYSNLAFLQEKVRLIGAAGPIQGPIYEFTQPVNGLAGAVEGFQMRQLVGERADSAEDITGDDRAAQHMAGISKSDQADLYMPTITPIPDDNTTPTKEELTDFNKRLKDEIKAMSASGTTDMVTNRLVARYTSIYNTIADWIKQLNAHTMFASDIPVTKQDIDNAFIKKNGKMTMKKQLPEAILDLALPVGMNSDPSGSQMKLSKDLKRFINKYADTILDGVSASFEVKYTSPREESIKEAEMARALASTVEQSGFPSMADLNNISNAKFVPMDTGIPVTDPMAQMPTDAGRGPAHFDWKERAKKIEEQVKRRGLNPKDFGIMPDNSKVSNEFSWRGYAKMMCQRLMTTTDPALPETCGCPKMDWPGWRSGK